jgi:hypothetical protein
MTTERDALRPSSKPRSGCSPIWFGWIVPSTVLGTIQRELRSSRRCDDGYAEVYRRDAGQALGLLPFLPEEGEREVNALDLTKPILAFGPSAAGQQVVFDLVEVWQHFGFMASIGQRKHECSCWQGVPYGPQMGQQHHEINSAHRP